MHLKFTSDVVVKTKVLASTLQCSGLRCGGCGVGGVAFSLQRPGDCALYAVKSFFRRVTFNICAKAAFADVRA